MPRSGSTLLQRILSSHPQISSKSEPWFMLPFVYNTRLEGLLSEYNQRDTFYAMQDFIRELPDGLLDYRQSLHDFAISLYRKQSESGALYFLDKTPRYHLIIEELTQIFPEAKFIFLTRNPLQIISSMISTFKIKNMHFYEVDLRKGFHNISRGISEMEGKSIVIKYEELIESQEATLDKLFNYLNLPWQNSLLQDFSKVEFKGRFGDKRGANQYVKISSNSMNQWTQNLSDWVLLRYAKNFIDKIDEDVLTAFGYSKTSLSHEVSSIKARFNTTSILNLKHILVSSFIRTLSLNLYRKRIRKWKKDIIIN